MLKNKYLERGLKNKRINEIKDYIKSKGLSINDDYLEILIAYHFTQFASMFRTTVHTSSIKFPVNMYACEISPSGSGKGVSLNILENEIFESAFNKFSDDLIPTVFNNSLKLYSYEKQEMMKKEDKSLGDYLPYFDSGSVPAVKQIRQKILLNKLGSLNLIIDEIGSNLETSEEVLNAFLELFDNGFLRQKALKNTKESSRKAERRGICPANLLMFGTNSNLLDAGSNEARFKNMLEKGYARRTFFAVCMDTVKPKKRTAQEEFDRLNNITTNLNTVSSNSIYFESLVIEDNIHKKIKLEKDTELIWLDYKLYCESESNKISEFEVLKKIEMAHRHSKVLKLAGALAFIEGNDKVSEENILDSIYLGELSGNNFSKLLELDKPYEKLAKFIKEKNGIVTPADLNNLPFYPKSKSDREEIIKLAESYALKNEFIINTTEIRGIKYYKALTFKKNNNKVNLYIEDFTTKDIKKNELDYSQLKGICDTKDQKFRLFDYIDNSVIFNTIGLKFRKTDSLDKVTTLLGMISHFIYEDNNFNVVLFPLNYNFDLPKDNFEKIILKLIKFLPFETKEIVGYLMSNNLNKYKDIFNSKYLNLLNFFEDTPGNIILQEKINNNNKISKDGILRWFALNMEEDNIDTIFNSYCNYLIVTNDSRGIAKLDELQSFNKHLLIQDYIVDKYKNKLKRNSSFFNI